MNRREGKYSQILRKIEKEINGGKEEDENGCIVIRGRRGRKRNIERKKERENVKKSLNMIKINKR